MIMESPRGRQPSAPLFDTVAPQQDKTPAHGWARACEMGCQS